ncbi:MAG: hypothetical protein IJX23_05810 [Clostridia bacterium]|nr:hypothetical protein [Clostridia bacterium]
MKFYNIYCYQYTGETIDYATGLFVEECRNIVDYGFDMYAPQTFANKTTLIG